jgi:hypothetical protein
MYPGLGLLRESLDWVRPSVCLTMVCFIIKFALNPMPRSQFNCLFEAWFEHKKCLNRVKIQHVSCIIHTSRPRTGTPPGSKSRYQEAVCVPTCHAV